MKHIGTLASLGFIAAMGLSGAYADSSNDETITQQVKSGITKSPDLGSEITVKTKNGVVFLAGKASTSLAKTNAENLAKGVPGVQKVIDNIGIEK